MGPSAYDGRPDTPQSAIGKISLRFCVTAGGREERNRWRAFDRATDPESTFEHSEKLTFTGISDGRCRLVRNHHSEQSLELWRTIPQPILLRTDAVKRD